MPSSLDKMVMIWKTYKRYLNGVFCIYKPSEMKTGKALAILKTQILKDLNSLPLHEPPKSVISKKFRMPTEHTEITSTTLPVNTSQSLTESSDYQLSERKETLLKFKLVFGEVFMNEDFYLECLCPLHYHSSGVLVASFGRRGFNDIKRIEEAKYLRVYHVKGRFGYATHNFFPEGNFIERSTYHHITKAKIDKVCSAAQSGHQRLMFEYAGVDPQSQEAYELACQGIIRPSSTDTPPLLYGVKCIYFNPPDFTLEIHAINETCEYLAELVNDIGLRLKSNAVCVHIHRIRHGHFVLADTLLHKDWSLPSVKDNIDYCRKYLEPEVLLTNLSISAAKKQDAKDRLLTDGQNFGGGQDLMEDQPTAWQIAKFYSRHGKNEEEQTENQELKR